MTINTLDPKPYQASPGTNDGDAERAAQKAKDAANTGIESGRQAINEAKEGLSAGIHAAQEKAGSVIDMARDAASNVASSVSDAACYAGQKAEAATSTVGGALESSGQYLKEDGLRHMASDITELIRRNPVPAMLIGIGLGVLVTQATSRRNS
jgi:hypothetical protein